MSANDEGTDEATFPTVPEDLAATLPPVETNWEAQYESKGPTDPWIHRSVHMLCKTCMWYVPKETRDTVALLKNKLGRCRRHAPIMSGYPVVYPNDWCGDHKVNENAE